MFQFNLSRVALLALEERETPDVDPGELPADLWDVIGTGGDQFRDWFTRLCLYMVLSGGDPSRPRTDDTVVIGTEYGNAAAVAGLQRAAAEQGRRLSAQAFPQAHSSSASAFVNLTIGATGRSITVNAAQLTPVLSLWQVLSAFAHGRSGAGHLLVGDVYSAEALADARHDETGLRHRSGVAYGVLTAGDEFTARFEFASDEKDVEGTEGTEGREHVGGHTWTSDDGDGRSPAAIGGDQPVERNGAFVTAEFLRLVLGLRPGRSAVLRCRGLDGRRATVTVSRKGGSDG
ncbi:hypothetical protein AB0395_40625 [Streptosporangium sp. NPDC051023]|uniref:hypothetical protein n=1 Tax=Streptosporangium sp. NPDC051023 TaxID=3155410 RepID=UPI003450DF40